MTLRRVSAFFPFLLVFYEITTYLSNDMYLPALPQMMRDLSMSMADAQLTLTTWFIGAASMPLVMGAISDRYGRRPVLLIGGMIYLVSTMICALTSSLPVLLTARLIQGGMMASMFVPGYACIHELYEHKTAIRKLALMGSITVLAPAFGPLLGGIVLQFMSWRAIFWIIFILAGIALVLLKKWMPETHPVEKRQPIHIGLLFKQYWQILTNATFMRLAFVLGCIFAGFIVWITAGPLLVIDSFHYTAIEFGIIQAGIFSAYILANHCVKYVMEWVGVCHLMRLGIGITLCGGLGLLAFALQYPNSIYPFVGAMTVYSFGSGLCFAPLNRSIVEASNVPMGVRVALSSVLFTGFGALGSALASVIYNGTIVSLAYIISISVIVACIVKIGNR